MKKWPKVSVIILNWNGRNDTIECLESLKNINYPNYEIIVVDNNSKGNDVEILRKKYEDRIHIIENDKNYGFAEGNNIGMRYALRKGTEYILLLNNDTIVDPEFLYELIKVAKNDERVGIVGPKTYYYDEPKKISFAGGKINLWKGASHHIGEGERDLGQYDKIKEVDYVEGSCFLIKRQVIEKIGMIDPKYFAYWEETDWCIRANRAGYKIMYIPKAKIWHKGSISTGKGANPTKTFYMARNRIIFMRKNVSVFRFIIFIFYFLLTIPKELGVHLKHKRINLVIPYFRGVARGFADHIKT